MNGVGYLTAWWFVRSNNMLYPSQDRDLRRLMFRCRNCGQSEEVEENCIYVNELVKDTRYVRTVCSCKSEHLSPY